VEAPPTTVGILLQSVKEETNITNNNTLIIANDLKEKTRYTFQLRIKDFKDHYLLYSKELWAIQLSSRFKQ